MNRRPKRPQHPAEMDPDQINDEARELLLLVAAEFRSDPMSVQCFDSRIVDRVVKLSDEINRRAKRALKFGF